jgi:protein-S-isoprenylcysteine O-methyltransferase Ste14
MTHARVVGPYAHDVRTWSWTVIQCCWGAWALLWLVMSFSAKRTVERPGGMWSWPAGLAAVAIYLTFRAAAGRSWDHQLGSTPPSIQVLAVVVVVAGLAFCAWARLGLGGNWSGSVVLKERHELIQTGPYGLARHPIYTGMLAMVVGSVLDFPAAVSYVGLVAIVVLFFFKSRREERLMLQHFPDEYAAYRSRVKALIPFVL